MKCKNQLGLLLVTLLTAEITVAAGIPKTVGSSSQAKANDGGEEVNANNEKNPPLTEEDVLSLIREARQKNNSPDLLKGVGSQLASGAQNLFTGVEHFVVNLLAGINDVNFLGQGIEPITTSTPDPDEETTPNEDEETSPVPVVVTTVRPPPITMTTTTTRPTTTTPKRRRSRPTKATPPPEQAAPIVPAVPAPAYLPVIPPYQPGQVPIYQILLPGYPHPVPVYQQLPIQAANAQALPAQVQNNEPLSSPPPPPSKLSSVQNEEPGFKLTGNRNRPSNGQQLLSVGGLGPIVPSNSEIFKIYPASEAPFRRRHETTKSAIATTEIPVTTTTTVKVELTRKPGKNRVTWPQQSTKRSVEHSTRRRLFVSNTAKPAAPPKNPPFGTIFKPKEPQNIHKEQQRPSVVAAVVPDVGLHSNVGGQSQSQGHGQAGSGFGGEGFPPPSPPVSGSGEGETVPEIFTEGPEIVTESPGEEGGPTTEEEGETTEEQPETEEGRDSRAKQNQS